VWDGKLYANNNVFEGKTQKGKFELVGGPVPNVVLPQQVRNLPKLD
jgi:hypothetical protein